jgi:hypothetical protein
MSICSRIRTTGKEREREREREREEERDAQTRQLKTNYMRPATLGS